MANVLRDACFNTSVQCIEKCICIWLSVHVDLHMLVVPFANVCGMLIACPMFWEMHPLNTTCLSRTGPFCPSSQCLGDAFVM